MEPRDEDYNGQDTPQAMAFTVTFDSPKAPCNNKFVKRHIRNLSLPVTKVYDNKSELETTLNGKCPKKPGNHSEGYFSSEEDPANKLLGDKARTPISYLGGCDRLAGEEEEEEEGSLMEEGSVEEEDEGGAGSDVASDTGTYTIDREEPEAITARLSIEANFGIASSGGPSPGPSGSSWVTQWASQTSQSTQSTQSTQPSKLRPSHPSKIPSPLAPRARLGASTSKQAGTLKPPLQSPVDPEGNETECYLKTTEKMMTALAARLSLDSGESDSEGTSRSSRGLHRSDSSASESAKPPLHKARSLRPSRGRLDESKPVESSSAVVTRTQVHRSVSSSASKTTLTPSSTSAPKSRTPLTAPPPLARSDSARLSLRAKQLPKSPQLSGDQAPRSLSAASNTVKKKPSGGVRSNSTLSSKEVEFQNWKRRKSYDPMKAAAEGKKKDATKKVSPMVQSVTNAHATPRSPVSSVLRSASFHGTRQLTLPSSSEEDEEITLPYEPEDWPPTLLAPKSSRESTPMGSRLSLASNPPSGSPRPRLKLEGVDNLVVSAVAALSGKLKISGSNLLRKLRFLYDEESDKRKQLSNEIQLLEAPDNGSPQKSLSKELASTLRNLKRLDSMLKVLDEVLFEDADYE